MVLKPRKGIRAFLSAVSTNFRSLTIRISSHLNHFSSMYWRQCKGMAMPMRGTISTTFDLLCKAYGNPVAKVFRHGSPPFPQCGSSRTTS